MNPYAYISLLTLEIYIIIAVIAWLKNFKDDLNRIFIIFCVLASFAAFAELGFRAANSRDTAYLWIMVAGFRPLAFSAMVHVILIFTEQNKLLKNAFTYLIIYGPALAIGFLWISTPLFVQKIINAPWGWTWEPQTPAAKIALFWSICLTATSLFLCWRYYHKSKGPIRQQAKLIAFGLSVAAFISIIADVILPALKISFPGMTTAAVAVGVLFIIFAIWKHELFSLTPATASEGIISTMSDSMFLVSPEGRVLAVNKAAATLLDQEPEEMMGKPIINMLITEKLGETFKPPPAYGIKDSEMILITKLGRNIPVSMSVSSVINNKKGVRGYVYIARDITERRLAQENLQILYNKEKTLRENLENEIKKRADFTRALVHELMTPLTAIIASTELLSDMSKDEPWLELTENIHWSSTTLQKRIDDLLDLSKGEMGMLKIKPSLIDLGKLFDQIFKNMYPIITRHKQSLTIELPPDLPEVYADENRLSQILFNLIDNASKYSQENETIILKATYNKDSLVISVQDKGVGISKEEQKQLFNPYTRLNSEKRKVGGIGLGLAISKILVELHGGEIWVESEKNRGSTFSFTLPPKR
jgi:PAS domain S-box-containing protein